MSPSYMPCCHNSARFAQNAHCVTGVVRAGPRYQHFTAFGCNLFHFFTLRKLGCRKEKGLLVGGEPNHISWGDLNPGLAEVGVKFNTCQAH